MSEGGEGGQMKTRYSVDSWVQFVVQFVVCSLFSAVFSVRFVVDG